MTALCAKRSELGIGSSVESVRRRSMFHLRASSNSDAESVLRHALVAEMLVEEGGGDTVSLGEAATACLGEVSGEYDGAG